MHSLSTLAPSGAPCPAPQEIYGLEQSGANKADTAAETLEDSEERLCVICLVNDRDTTVLPCRHMCMCHECAQVRWAGF